jgi:uncharacterized protein
MSRSQIQILLFLAAVFALGAVLAPPLYWGGKALADVIVSFKQTETPVIGWIGRKLASHQFDSYYNRAFLISALALLWPFLKWMRLSADTRGLEKNPMPVRDVLAGFVIAAGLLAVLTAGLLAWGAYVREEPVNWVGIVPRAMFIGIVVALLEEWIFRGIFLGVALRSSRPWTAIIVVSALFSILHLVKAPDILVRDPASRKAAVSVLKSNDWPDLVKALRTKPSAADWMIDKEYRQFAPGRIHWGSGIGMTAAIFKKKAAPALFVSEFLTLFAIGVILARARCATRSLWLPIGLHAGWIFANAVCLGITKESDALGAGKFALAVGNTRIPWIGHELKFGLLPLLTLMVTAVAVEWWLLRRGGGIQSSD